jgi:hypothetical protein
MAGYEQYIPPGLRGPLKDIFGMARVTGEGGAGLLRAVQEDPLAVNKAIGESMIGGIQSMATDPFGTVRGVVSDTAGTVQRALTNTAVDYLPEGVTLSSATPEQLKMANDARYADLASTAAMAVPGAKALKVGAKAAGDVDYSGLAADATYAGRSIAQGDPRGLIEAFQRGGEGESLSAAKNTQIMRGSDYFDPPRSGGGSARDAALFTPFSQNVKQKTAPYNWEVEANIVDAGYTAPTLISPSELQGTDMYFLAGDRTAGGREVTRVGQLQLQRPVRLEAGAEYMDTDQVWASHSGVMKPKQNVFSSPENAERDIRVGFVPMGERSGDFAKHQGQLYSEMLFSSQMPRKVVKTVNQELKSIVGDFRQKALNKQNKQRVKDGLKPLTRVTTSDIPSVDSPEFRDWFDTQSPEQVRKPFLQRMDKSDMKKLDGVPDVGEMRFAATNPDLVQSPSFSAGYRFAIPDIKRGLLSADHASYDTGLGKVQGTGSQTFGVDVPWTISARDTALPRLAAAALEKGTFYPGQNMPFSGRSYTLPSDQRVFTMNPKTMQTGDQQYVDEASTYIDRFQRGGLEDATRYEMGLLEAYLRGL